MKSLANYTLILLLSIFSFSSFFPFGSLHAQVTIGSNHEPAKGAILELKQKDGSLGLANSNKGLGMPRVAQEELSSLSPCVKGAAGQTTTAKTGHVGLLLYNTTIDAQEKLCPGIYVWTEAIWERLYGSCDGFTIKNEVQTYVRDGQEYSFKMSSFNAWTAEIIDTDGVFESINTPLFGAAVGDLEFKFKLNVNLTSDAEAKIIFTNDLGTKHEVVVKALKMTFVVPADFTAVNVDGETVNFSYSSNSSRPFVVTVANNETWLNVNQSTQQLTVAANDDAQRTTTITVSNGAKSQEVNVTQSKLEFSVTHLTLGFFPAGGAISPIVSTNSARAVSTTSNAAWLLVGGSASQPLAVVGANSTASQRNGTLTLKLGSTKTIDISVFQYGKVAYGYSHSMAGTSAAPRIEMFGSGPFTGSFTIVCNIPFEYINYQVTSSNVTVSNVSVTKNSETSYSVSFKGDVSGNSGGTINFNFKPKSPLPGGMVWNDVTAIHQYPITVKIDGGN